MIGRSNLFITLINQNNPDAYDKIEDALERGNLSPDASDDNGAPLLLCAVRRRNYRLAELLLNEGANPFIISKYGQCAAGLIERFGDDRLRRIVQDVGDSGAIFDAVGEAWPIAQGLCLDAALGRTPEIRKKVAGGISVEERDAWGHTALMLAVLHGQDQAAQALFQSGANPESPQTLLGYQMIRFLNALKFLQADEFTQSMTAIYKKLSVFLFQSPSSTEAITTDNLASIASIHHLVRRSDITRIERLLALGVSPLLKNSRGFSALDVADQTHETQAKEVLLRHAGMQVPCPAGGRAVASASTASAPKAGQLTVKPELREVRFTTLSGILVVTRKDDLFSLEFPTFPLREVEEADVLEAVEKAIGVKPAKIYMGPIWSACLRAKKGSCGSPRPSACARSRRCVPARDGASEGRRIRLHHALLRAQVRRSRRPCLRARSLPRRLDLGEGARQIRAHRVSGFGSRRRPLLPL